VNRAVFGVLGGMGSYSTLHFFGEILDAFEVEKEWERPRIVVDNNCVLPSRVLAILRGELRAELVSGMADSIRTLLTGYDPDAIVIPCHTAHVFLPEVRAVLAVADDRVLDMIGVTADHCRDTGATEVFLMATEGTIASKVFDGYCGERGVAVRYPDEAQQTQLRDFIEQVKQKKPTNPEAWSRFVESLGSDRVILGCTELSVLAAGRRAIPGVELIDPIALLVARLHAIAQDKYDD